MIFFTLNHSKFSSLLKSLYNLQRFGIKLGLEHTFHLLDSIGNPQDDLRFIHVAGTNGKGSTCAIIESILRASGKKVGLYTSPHLCRFNERIRVNGIPISDEDIIIFMRKISKDIKKIKSTFFETSTAMAFDHFKMKKVDIAVIETGLGGSLDSTNVIIPDLSVITSISMDHKDILGDTVEKIAMEKAGIIKSEIPLVFSEQKKVVEDILIKKAKKVNSKFVIVKDCFVNNISLNKYGCKFFFEDELYRLPLIGVHQAYNAALAIKAIKNYDETIKTSHLRLGIKTVHWPGRLELVDKFIFYDVAHNQSGIFYAIKAIKTVFPEKPLIGLFCLKKNKEIKMIVKEFYNHIEKLYITRDKKRFLIDPYKLSGAINKMGFESKPVNTVSEGISKIKIQIKKGYVGLIFGSHFIAEEVYEEF